MLARITSAAELTALVQEIGFLPFFTSPIPGYSLKECTPEELWFVEGVEGPWEWRETLAAEGEVAYGKFFGKKAGFISREWFPHFANYRRDGYDFDALYEDGLASHKCKRIMDALAQNGPMLTSDLKRQCGFGPGGEKGFDTAMTALQMQTYIVVHHFQYRTDRYGRSYGWGVGCYTTGEDRFGPELVTAAYSVPPAESFGRLCRQLGLLFPRVFDDDIVRCLR